MPGITLVEDFVWFENQRIWVLHCKITAAVEQEGLIPQSTDWYIHASDAYPYGPVVFYPAKAGGLTLTFNHQNHNSTGPAELPWRCGRLCVDTSMRTLGRRSYDVEPFDPDSRLAWHVHRVKEWLRLASRDDLVQLGDPFELPHIPCYSDLKVVFAERPEDLVIWQGRNARWGTANVRALQKNFPILVVDEFRARRQGNDFHPPWSKSLGEDYDLSVAWIWLDKMPTIYPWAIPTSWGEFRACCQNQGIDLDSLLRPAVRDLRDGGEHLLLIGFPIPAEVAGPDVRAHWLCIRVPPLTSRPVDGFRPTEDGYWNRDRSQAFGDTVPLQWVETQNWDQDEITGRGRMDQSIRSKSILMIGGGAVGSALAEILVRAGAQRVTIMDHDRLEAGNLVRHTLGVSHVGRHKASALSERLDGAAVHSTVSSIDARFPPRSPEDLDLVLNADIVIDCSADDSVAKEMERFDWDGPLTFVSVSVGLKSLRSFTYVAHGETFPADDFVSRLDPWLRSEMDGYDDELPRDGIGCWHALMPARSDDIWMMASAMVKTIEAAIAAPSAEPTLTVFEQYYEEGVFIGLRKVP